MPKWGVFRQSKLMFGLMVLTCLPLQAADTERIVNQYETYEDLQKALKEANIEGCNVILAYDFTKSNLIKGASTYARNFSTTQETVFFSNLHWINPQYRNPYQIATQILTNTLAPFDEDQIYPVLGFGDVNSKAQRVFHIKMDDRNCHGIPEVFQAYTTTLETLQMAGPTSFAPAIHEAMNIIYDNDGSYHILVLMTDGEITEGLEEENYQALVKASLYPLSIIVIGIGDGPFDLMNDFDNKVKGRLFDNLQFVELSKIITGMSTIQKTEVDFAHKALAELPEQYAAIKKMGMLSTDYRTKVLSTIHKLNPLDESDLLEIKERIANLKKPKKKTSQKTVKEPAKKSKKPHKKEGEKKTTKKDHKKDKRKS